MARSCRARPSDPEKSTALWPCALYIRLSREDGDKEESDSIVNQRAMLSAYIAASPELIVHDVYTDDGYTGANFDRPAFQRMLSDIQRGAVRCVIVKDLSRLGRNYIETGRFLEQVFPSLHVRFIALNDRIDSYADPSSASGLLVPFRNLINDEYCRDISAKVRSALDTKRRQGQFIGSFAPYGYLKSPKDHNRLIIDQDTAPVVRDIFRRYLAGQSILSIARHLQRMNLPTPAARKKGLTDCLWSDSAVRRILSSCVYAGHTAQGKRRSINHRLNRSVCVPSEEWLVVRNTHEAIIDEETFERVEALMRRDTRVAPSRSEVYLFSGLLFCADCGRPMHRKAIVQPYGVYVYYICSGYKKHRVCSKHTLRADWLEKAVSQTVASHIQLAMSADELLAAMQRSELNDPGRALILRRVAALESERRQTEQMKLSLYPDWKSGMISQEDYLALRDRFAKRLEELDRSLLSLSEEASGLSRAPSHAREALSHFIRHRQFERLTRELVTELIERIDVSEGGKIAISFRYRDEFTLADALTRGD